MGDRCFDCGVWMPPANPIDAASIPYCGACLEKRFPRVESHPMTSDDTRERLARVMCKASRPVVNPDKILDMWEIGRDGNGNPVQMAFNPYREWQARLPLVDAILAEQAAIERERTGR